MAVDPDIMKKAAEYIAQQQQAPTFTQINAARDAAKHDMAEKRKNHEHGNFKDEITEELAKHIGQINARQVANNFMNAATSALGGISVIDDGKYSPSKPTVLDGSAFSKGETGVKI